jgi:hypothetical protein
MDSILYMDPADLDAMLYNYQQVKKLLLKFNLPFTKGMKKPSMMAALLVLREETNLAQATAASASATAAPTNTPMAVDVDEEGQLKIVAQQVNTFKAEEEDLVDPAPVVELTKAEHGAEMAELDAKFEKIGRGNDCDGRRDD